MYDGRSSEPSRKTFRNTDAAGTHGIPGTPHSSGVCACGTSAWNAATVATASTAHAARRAVLTPPCCGASFHTSVKESATREKATRNATVGHQAPRTPGPWSPPEPT
uniref:Uncharacterized protein n=1 Tax=Arundo donax TaxID=35708 RepID=A0A0A9GAN6_ARUDO